MFASSLRSQLPVAEYQQIIISAVLHYNPISKPSTNLNRNPHLNRNPILNPKPRS